MNLQSTSFSKQLLTFLFLSIPIVCNAQGQIESPNLILRKFFSVSWGILVLAVTLYFAIKYVKEKRFDPKKPGIIKFLLFWGLGYPIASAFFSIVANIIICTLLGVSSDPPESTFIYNAYALLPYASMWICALPLAFYLYKPVTPVYSTQGTSASSGGGVSVTVVDANGNRISQTTRSSNTPLPTAPTSSIPTPEELATKKDISIEYYNLLKETFIDLHSLYLKLCNDEALLKDLTLASGIDPDVLISMILKNDLSKIAKLLNENYTKEDPEIISLAVLNQVTYDNDIFNYEHLNKAFKLNMIGAESESILRESKSDCILSMNPSTLSDGKLAPIEIDKTFTFIPLLQAKDNPLFDEYAAMLYRIANVIVKSDGVVTKEEEARLKVLYHKLHNSIPGKESTPLNVSSDNSTIEEIQKELNSLIGLDHIKQEVETLINFIKVQKAREEAGLKSTDISYHLVFTGNPGTGKTTVARIIAKVYKALGILKEGQLVETDRSGLIAEYSGQTAVKTNKTIDSAINGVLFIDEAYSLIGENKDDYGKEALATLLKRMEDDRDKLVVIVAGYTSEMKTFIDTNPGLRSRFNRYFEFADYSSEELLNIYKLQCSRLEYKVNSDAEAKVASIMQKAYTGRDSSFGNGRFARNLFEKTLERQANRIASIAQLNKDILITITEEDIPTSY